jgi:hypothetical protein
MAIGTFPDMMVTNREVSASAEQSIFPKALRTRHYTDISICVEDCPVYLTVLDYTVAKLTRPEMWSLEKCKAAERRRSQPGSKSLDPFGYLIITVTWSGPRGVAGYTEAQACAWYVCQPVLSDP